MSILNQGYSYSYSIIPSGEMLAYFLILSASTLMRMR